MDGFIINTTMSHYQIVIPLMIHFSKDLINGKIRFQDLDSTLQGWLLLIQDFWITKKRDKINMQMNGPQSQEELDLDRF
jgi:hypothetical protein